MKNVFMKFGLNQVELKLPDQTEVLTMTTPTPLSNSQAAIAESLQNSIGCLASWAPALEGRSRSQADQQDRLVRVSHFLLAALAY